MRCKLCGQDLTNARVVLGPEVETIHRNVHTQEIIHRGWMILQNIHLFGWKQEYTRDVSKLFEDQLLVIGPIFER